MSSEAAASPASSISIARSALHCTAHVHLALLTEHGISVVLGHSV